MSRQSVARAWLANWLPIMAVGTVLCGCVFGLWTLFASAHARQFHLPPAPLYWVLGTMWVSLGLYAAMVASSDYKITLKQWSGRDA